jgi:Na+/H+-dicarboxylate symporter
MLAAPIIFTMVVVGIAKTQDIKSVGRIGLNALVYFELATTAALLIGLVVGKLIQPGTGMNVDPHALDASSVAGLTRTAQSHGLVEFLLHLIPDTVVGAFVEDDILQVVLISVLSGVALARLGQRGQPVLAGRCRPVQRRNLPVAAIALLVGVDRFMGEAWAVTSMIGNAMATLAVARWEGALDLGLARQVLAGHNSVMAWPPQTFAPVPDSN